MLLLLKAIRLYYRLKRKLILILRPTLRLEHASRQAFSKLLGGEILSAVDVGGAVDLQPHWYKAVGNAEFHIFEPHPKSCAEIRARYSRSSFSRQFHVHEVALSGTGGRRTLFATNAPTGSTIIPLNLASPYVQKDNSYFFPLKEIPIDTVTLEKALPIPAVDIIKLDVQGAELEILSGLGAKLKDLLAVELELNLNNIYCSGSTMDNLWQFLCNNQLELLDVKVARDYLQRNGRKEALMKKLGFLEWAPSVAAKSWELDVVAFRRPDSLLASRDKAAIRRLIACYCIYNFFLEALGLAEEAASHGILTSQEAADISEGVFQLKKSIDIDLEFLESFMSGTDRLQWSQYIWLRLPSS